jgi:hypothetical protein
MAEAHGTGIMMLYAMYRAVECSFASLMLVHVVGSCPKINYPSQIP